jgi:hypothetical protein
MYNIIKIQYTYIHNNLMHLNHFGNWNFVPKINVFLQYKMIDEDLLFLLYVHTCSE